MYKSILINVLLKVQIVICLLLVFTPKTHAQLVKPYVTVENVRQNWLVYDNKSNEFLPFVEETFNPPYLHFKLNMDKYEKYFLALKVPEQSSIFVENQIVDFSKDPYTYFFSIDSLKKEYLKDDLLISVFSEFHLSQNMQSLIVDFSPLRGFDVKKIDFHSEVRSQKKFNDFNILSILIIFVLGTIIRTVQGKVFGEYFEFRRIFSLKPKSEVLYSASLLSLQNLSFLFLYGVTIGFSVCNLMLWVNPSLLLNFGFSNTIDFVMVASVLTLFFMSLIILKYPLLHFISNIYLFKKTKKVHYFEYLRISIFISLVFLFCSIFNNFSNGNFINLHMKLIVGIVITLFISRTVLVFLKLNNLQSFRKLHLFTYLCSTEIIPLIILLKIFNIYIEVV